MQEERVDTARHSAYLNAYALLERVQGEDYLDAAQELPIAISRAEAAGWQDVRFVLHTAETVHRMARAEHPEGSLQAVAQLMRRAESLQAPAYLAIALGLGALAAGADDPAQLLSGAARAVALLDDDSLPPMARCLAYVVVAGAFNALSLWELVDELYDQALLLTPASDLALQTEAVAVNRALIRLEWALALLENGELEAASEQFDQVLVAAEMALTLKLRPLWRSDVLACCDAARLLRSTSTAVVAKMLPGILASVRRYHGRLVEGGDLETVALLDAAIALTHFRLGNLTAARRIADRLRPPQSFASGARTFPLWVKATVLGADLPPDVAAAQGGYADMVSRMRWESRSAILAAARAQISVERRKTDHDRLHQAAHTDPLTGLKNRAVFDRWLRDGGGPAGGQTALMLIDLNDFKRINDTYGHHCGDAVLRRIGKLLRESTRTDDLAIRQGGDEFALIMSQEQIDEQAVVRRARSLDAAIRAEPWSEIADGLAVATSIGVGCTTVDTQQFDADGVLRDAHLLYTATDAALYESKRTGEPMAAVMPQPVTPI